MPWMVTFFGILVIPLGLTHIILVISQPVVVGHWCTLCLLAAAIMLPMIPLEVDEVVAMGQHVRQAKRRGDRGGSLWTIFWKGGQAGSATEDERSPELMSLPQQPVKVFRASIWGMTAPWTLVVSAAVGVWLMAAPGTLGTEGMAAHILHLGGALVVTVSVIAMGEVVRTLRLLNMLLGLVVAIGPWVVGGRRLAPRSTPRCAGWRWWGWRCRGGGSRSGMGGGRGGSGENCVRARYPVILAGKCRTAIQSFSSLSSRLARSAMTAFPFAQGFGPARRSIWAAAASAARRRFSAAAILSAITADGPRPATCLAAPHGCDDRRRRLSIAAPIRMPHGTGKETSKVGWSSGLRARVGQSAVSRTRPRGLQGRT
jgi:hypothetical protein